MMAITSFHDKASQAIIQFNKISKKTKKSIKPKKKISAEKQKKITEEKAKLAKQFSN